MNSFLDDIVEQLKTTDLSKQYILFPSKRAATIFRYKLVNATHEPLILPQLKDIESFIEELSEVTIIDHTETIFKFYEAYKSITPKDSLDDFETFYAWADTLIHDFNEIDRYNVAADQLFNYLSDIKDIEHWSNAPNQTKLVKNYLKFWKHLPDYYNALTQLLLKNSQAYQGLAYRKVLSKATNFIAHSSHQFSLIGFNALNTCEIELFKILLNSGQAKAYWDIDHYLLQNHKSAEFIRSYNTWPFYSNKPIKPSTKSFSHPKEIKLYEVSKTIGQAKAVSQILDSMSTQELNRTALVLGDESMLLPIVNSIPKSVKKANITMGLALSRSVLSAFFDHIINLQINKTTELYFKDFLNCINHTLLQQQFPSEINQINNYIKSKNILLIKLDSLQKELLLPAEFIELIKPVLKPSNHPRDFISQLLKFIQNCYKKELNKTTAYLLQQFQEIFTQLQDLLNTYQYQLSFKNIKSLYLDLLSSKSLDFKGSAKQGLQILGMLETRVLDFETIIITGLNEGILPSGKSQNSYLPFDLKYQYGLPTYTEKDNVYGYHFFRLMQRAKQAHLLFNIEAEGMQKAEQSRFITQLEVFKRPNHSITKFSVSAETNLDKTTLKEIPKTPEMISQLQDLFANGISPTALTTYIRNPIDFYEKYLLGIREQDEVDEQISFKTHGTVVHETLEELYKGYLNEIISADVIKSFLKNYTTVLTQQFEQHFDAEAIKFGQNKLHFEVAKQQLKRFLVQELQLVEDNQLTLVSLEQKKGVNFSLQSGFKAKLKGTVDRIDQLNGQIRIIDYKTGKVGATQLRLNESWEGLTSDYKYSKAFQVLFYSLLIEDQLDSPVTAGIISFKNLNEGFIPLNKKQGRKTLPIEISPDILKEFKVQLDQLITEILNPDIPFSEKEV